MFNYDKKKVMIGFLLGFFLNIIGLAIGVFMYKCETNEWKNFIQGWLLAFAFHIFAAVAFGIIYSIIAISLLI